MIDGFSKLYDKHPLLMGATEIASGAILAFGSSFNKHLPKPNTTTLKNLHKAHK